MMSNNKNMNSAYIKKKRVANLILFSSVFALLIVLALEFHYGKSTSVVLYSIGYVIEAVLIASAADGLAIRALTNKVNLPFIKNHTGLIELKHNELIRGIMVAFEQKFFPRVNVRWIVGQFNMVKFACSVVEKNAILKDGKKLGRRVAFLIRRFKTQISNFTYNLIKKYLINLDIERVIKSIHNIIVEKGWITAAVSNLFDAIQINVEKEDFRIQLKSKIDEMLSSEKNLFKKFFNWVAKKTNILNSHDLSIQIQRAIIHVLNDLSKKEEGIQKWNLVEEGISEIIIKLADNESFTQELKSIIVALFEKRDIRPYIEKGLVSASKWLEDGVISSDEIGNIMKRLVSNYRSDEMVIDVSKMITDAISIALTNFSENEDKIQLEFKKFAEKLVDEQYKDVIGIIGEVLENLSVTDLVHEVNNVAGENLQWLRISGAYVGGIVGVFVTLTIFFPVIFLPIFSVSMIALICSKKLRHKLVKSTCSNHEQEM